MNFGALARYKIPALPFYFSAMVILLDSRNRKANIAAFNQEKKPEKLPLKEELSGFPLQ
jgi:hypothetical protein